MRDIDNLFLEQLDSDMFQSVVSDDFDFADRLIDDQDLDRILNKKEDMNNASND